MDILVLKELFYADKPFESFDIDSTDSIFRVFFYELLHTKGTRINDKFLEENLLNLFNDACAVGTLATIIKRPYLKIGDFLNAFNSNLAGLPESGEKRAEEILCLAYYLLKLSGYDSDDLNRFYKNVYNYFGPFHKSESSEFFSKLGRKIALAPLTPPKGFIKRRVLTKDVLSNIYIDWVEATGLIDFKEIDAYLELCKTPQEYNLIIDNIISRLRHTQYEYNIDFLRDKKYPADAVSFPEEDIEFPPEPFSDDENDNEKQNLISKVKELEEELANLKNEQEKEPVPAFNAQTGESCLTSTQIGILMEGVSLLTEEPVPGKTTLGEVVESISGYKATTVNQNMKGSHRDADKEAVAKAIESRLPKLAAKIRKL